MKRRFTPSPAMVVALVALFVALGGTSYAALSLPKNSVGTKQLQNGAVTAAKISSAAAGSVKVVGKAGAPAYTYPWGPAIETDEGVSFYKDAFGIVHFQGSATNGAVVLRHRATPDIVPSNDVLFTLPAGYRPKGDLWFAVYGNAGSAAYIEIKSTGVVQQMFSSAPYLGLGNISFRAGT